MTQLRDILYSSNHRQAHGFCLELEQQSKASDELYYAFPLFLEMLQSLSQLKAATIDARRAEIMQMACKSAVKGGDTLSDSEIRALIREMLETGAPPTCPHGRPVVKALSRRDLEKMFKRIQ